MLIYESDPAPGRAENGWRIRGTQPGRTYIDRHKTVAVS